MNVLLVGYGYMGKIRHRVLRQHPSVRTITVVDPALDASSELGQTMLPAGAAIPWDGVDAVFVCTPNYVTAALCAEAIRRCGRVFCEKPPGRNWEEFRHIAETAATVRDPILMFGFNHRLHPSVQAAKALVGEGDLGEILYVKGTYGKSGGLHFRQNWRSQLALAGGGILLDQGIHLLDLFHLFLGRLSVVDAILTDSFWGCGVEDNAFLLLRNDQGIPAFLHSSATLWKHTFRIEIGCAKGYVVASGFLSQTGSYGREQLVIGKRQFEDEAMALGNPREEIIYFDRDESWEKEVQEFLSAVKERRPAQHGTLDDAQEVMRLIRDAYAVAERQTSKRGTHESD
ncbi:MAG: Gfo/Idh/MocA family oxidoreductase [Candidatus Omnitrophica bacterium]|nr:Gfo/Idh/MocA family oxidoreductase [Candidatus Omnitrophota bacterium]